MARDLTKPSKASIAKKRWTQKGEAEGTRPLPATQKPLAGLTVIPWIPAVGQDPNLVGHRQRNQEMDPFLSSPILAQNVQW